MDSIVSDVTTGVFTALVSAAIIILAYAYQRALRLRNAIRSIHAEITKALKSGEDERIAKLKMLLGLLSRELDREDDRTFRLRVSEELALRELCALATKWVDDYASTVDPITAQSIKVRVIPPDGAMDEYLEQLRKAANRINVWSFLER